MPKSTTEPKQLVLSNNQMQLLLLGRDVENPFKASLGLAKGDRVVCKSDNGSSGQAKVVTCELGEEESSFLVLVTLRKVS